MSGLDNVHSRTNGISVLCAAPRNHESGRAGGYDTGDRKSGDNGRLRLGAVSPRVSMARTIATKRKSSPRIGESMEIA
jgi:hypothetical protein